MKAEQREELRRLADQCICHPVSRGVREVEQAGEAIKDLLDALEAADKALAQPAHEAETVAQWQKKHPLRTDGLWENTYEHDAKWWRDQAKGWDIRALYTTPQQSQPLTDEQIEKGRKSVFSTDNPFCPCDRKTMLKAVRWAEEAHKIKGVTE